MAAQQDYRPSYRHGFARCAAESEQPSLWQGLVGAWTPSLGATGNRLLDWSGRRSHAVVAGAGWTPTDRGPALAFNGSTDYVDCGNAVPSGTSAFTISAWVQSTRASTNAGAYWYIANRGSIFTAGFGIEFYDRSAAGTQGFEVWSRGESYAGIRAPLLYRPLSEWNHVVGTYERTTLRLYINGVLGNSGAGTAASSTALPFRIANDTRDDGTGYSWQGRIGPVAVWNRAVSLNEVQRLYADPLGMFRPRAGAFKTAVRRPCAAYRRILASTYGVSQ